MAGFDGSKYFRAGLQSLLSSLDLEYSTLTDGIVDGSRTPPPENMTFTEGSLGHLDPQDYLAQRNIQRSAQSWLELAVFNNHWLSGMY